MADMEVDPPETSTGVDKKSKKVKDTSGKKRFEVKKVRFERRGILSSSLSPMILRSYAVIAFVSVSCSGMRCLFGLGVSHLT